MKENGWNHVYYTSNKPEFRSAGFAQFRNSGAPAHCFVNQFVYLSVDDGIGCALSRTDFPTFFMGLPRHPFNFAQGLFLTGICAVSASLAVQRRGFLHLQPADFLVCRSSDFEDGNLAADSTLLLVDLFLFQFHVHRSIPSQQPCAFHFRSQIERVDGAYPSAFLV